MNFDPSAVSPTDLAADVLRLCDELSRCTEVEGEICRRYLSPPTRRVHDLLAKRMRVLGMSVRTDAAGNLIGRRSGGADRSPCLMIGSHIDTVPGAGRYDGVLGVLIGLSVIEAFGESTPPVPVEVVALSEEEGVRFQQPYLGSAAICGCFPPEWLERTDECGGTVAGAIREYGLDPTQVPAAAREPETVLGFIEPHIEQGPVLARLGKPVGVVDAIAGQTRMLVGFLGSAGHAGTVPMEGRRDALVAAARWIAATNDDAKSVEGLRVTIGQCDVWPAARNVIPGRCHLSIDLRHGVDAIRETAVDRVLAMAAEIATRSGVELEVLERQTQAAAMMDVGLTGRLAAAVADTDRNGDPFRLVSGAGHDAAIMAGRFPTTMLFIRQAKGISHHPDEDVDAADVAVAIEVLTRMVRGWR